MSVRSREAAGRGFWTFIVCLAMWSATGAQFELRVVIVVIGLMFLAYVHEWNRHSDSRAGNH